MTRRGVGTGLPDGIFSNQIFGEIFQGLEMQDVGIFKGHLLCFTDI
jgi:hypothetical protein